MYEFIERKFRPTDHCDGYVDAMNKKLAEDNKSPAYYAGYDMGMFDYAYEQSLKLLSKREGNQKFKHMGKEVSWA